MDSPPAARCFASRLAGFGERPALIHAGTEISYAHLARLVAAASDRYGGGRRLVLIAGSNRLDCVVAYLGALAAGHVVLLVPGDVDRHVDRWIADYDPDVVVRGRKDALAIEQRRHGTAHVLHPELALLLTTSGSTGSAKLVRLSYDNLQSNAEAIATFLDIAPQDRAVTTLPMSYCYGLSVLSSHLVRGAAVVLTDLSVVDPCFWDLCRQERVSSLAGVPYTFQLLDRVGFLDMHLPDLRRVTQAGGRMPAEQVRRYALAGRRRSWQLFVMYGQTEATARMAYLPPDIAADRSEAIGVAIPGGRLRLEPVPECGGDDCGELVFTGPNVMLGYATSPADLRLGRTVHELRTGDLARRGRDGLFELLGRRARFAKVFGLRVDLDAVERELALAGVTAWCTGVEDCLVVLAQAGTADTVEPSTVARVAADASGLPLRATRVVTVDTLPRSGNGKIDAPSAAALAVAAPGADAAHPLVAATGPGHGVQALFAEVLDLAEVPEGSTFAGLGGDSLSYVELSVRLEDLLGDLPTGWQVTPVEQLAALAARRDGADSHRQRTSLDTSVLLRAVGILLILGTHAHLFRMVGGAHALLAVAGYNFARFQLTTAPRRERLRSVGRAACRVVVPSVVCISLAAAFTPGIGLAQISLLNSVFGPDVLGPSWRYWFVEALVQLTVVLGALLSLPVVDRAERRHPFGFPVALLGVGLFLRFGLVPLVDGPDQTQSGVALLWLFLLGWCAAKARGTRQQAVVTCAALGTVGGFFDNPAREAVVLAAVLLLTWTTRIPVPRLLRSARPAVGLVAGSSLYVYLTHWQVLPLRALHPLVAIAAALAVGVAVWRLTGVASAWVRTSWTGRDPGHPVPGSAGVAVTRPRRAPASARAGGAPAAAPVAIAHSASLTGSAGLRRRGAQRAAPADQRRAEQPMLLLRSRSERTSAPVSR